MGISTAIGTLITICIITGIFGQECGPERFTGCMSTIYNSSYGHDHGLFQNADDLYDTCPTLKGGMTCVENFAKECGTEMIAEDFKDQFGKPMKLIDEVCIMNSPLRAEYLQHSPCLLENTGEFGACSEKIQEFLSNFEANDEQKEITVSCLYDLMFRSCLLSTATNACGLDAGTFVRKALQYTPISGLKMCFTDMPTALP